MKEEALQAVMQIAQGLRNANIPYRLNREAAMLTISGHDIVANAKTIEETFRKKIADAQRELDGEK